MNHPKIPQSLVHGSQASEGNSSIPPQSHYHSIDDFLSTASQSPRPNRHPESQSLLLERDPQCPQLLAPASQASSSMPPSSYAPGRAQQDPASLESSYFQQLLYTASQLSSQDSRPSSDYNTITPSDRYLSDQEYCEGATAPFFPGLEGSLSDHGYHTYNGYGHPPTSMDASGQLVVPVPSVEPSIGKPSSENLVTSLSGMDSWWSPPVLGGANVLNNNHSLNGLTVNPSQIRNLLPMENSHARQDQGTYSEEISHPVGSFMLGINPSLQLPNFSEKYEPFLEDANSKITDALNLQKEVYPRVPGYVGNTGPSNSSASAPRYAPDTRDTQPSTTSNLTPPLDHGAHSQPAPKSSKRCLFCDGEFSNPDNRRRHERHIHGEKSSYKGLLEKDGLACTSVTTDRRNRRNHVEVFHPRESAELPPRSRNHRPNDRTDKMLNRWFT